LWLIVIHRARLPSLRLLMEVLATALIVEVRLRHRPVERVLLDEMAQPRTNSKTGAPTAPAALERAIRVAYRALPFERTCLRHSLVFCRLRRRRREPAQLRIGVQKSGGIFAAHAWVEDDEGNVLTDPLEGFSALPLAARPGDERASD
jgi:hypothetical protein